MTLLDKLIISGFLLAFLVGLAIYLIPRSDDGVTRRGDLADRQPPEPYEPLGPLEEPARRWWGL